RRAAGGFPGCPVAARRNVNGLAQQLVRYGVLLVAGNVFLEQLGLPIPAMPLFVVAGALVAQGRLAGPQLLLAVLGSALLADTIWFLLGRKYGWHILRFLCGLSLSADTCVRKTSSAYDRFGLRALLFAKFVPGLSAVSVPVAGALKAPFLRFLAYDAAGTLIWAGTGIGLGAVFHEQVEAVLDLLRQFGTGALGILAVGLAVYLAFRLWRRQQTLATLRMARLTPQTLAARLLAGDENLVVVDVRHRLSRRDDPRRIPGALVADLGELDAKLGDIPVGKDVALYCT
ncbi:MAG TPA: VTT domain-containing protein, partial [Thermoanaerobaculia bacterium]|nr:VTT domain-containing protein [Thermoanaerobaculia bacterium]